MSHIGVHRDDEESRYVVLVDDEPVGYLEFFARSGVVNLLHTEVDPAYQGKGVASTLVRHALDDIRAQSMEIIPTCSYVEEWVEAHPAYADLLTS